MYVECTPQWYATYRILNTIQRSVHRTVHNIGIVSEVRKRTFETLVNLSYAICCEFPVTSVIATAVYFCSLLLHILCNVSISLKTNGDKRATFKNSNKIIERESNTAVI